ncbi:hypothetical protein L208DRAFT_1333095 [Tricholoma matsutake]|nr:hypothetical protein L208DRAFT_1333095 [Tricholoma matsutake 945]
MHPQYPHSHSGYSPPQVHAYPQPHGVPGVVGGPPAPPPLGAIIHTDDAATKLSDRVRRRCFNCCTTDTSTWRRSNLSPGKVVSTSSVHTQFPTNTLFCFFCKALQQMRFV